VEDPVLPKKGKEKEELLLHDTIDVTASQVWFIEDLPGTAGMKDPPVKG
jgi:hypothetical protein